VCDVDQDETRHNIESVRHVSGVTTAIIIVVLLCVAGGLVYWVARGPGARS
jgi:hypothetical protein